MEYPAHLAAQPGHVVMLLFINSKGGVDSYRLVESDSHVDFDQSAIKAFVSARFFPGKIAGYPVRSQMLVEINYLPGTVPEPVTIDVP